MNKDKLAVALICAIPLSSVLMGVLMLWLAINTPEHEAAVSDRPLSKISWQQP